jgi:Rps23 Pro-64 3,4-dihydroxylase Tpa1-like proline 4-hydroxylase
MINDGIDPGRWRAELAQRGRVQIPSYLQDDAAERLNLCLREEVPWTLAWRGAGEPGVLSHDELRAMDEGQYAALLRSLAAEARGNYGFAYESYMMVRAYNEGRDPQLVLHRVLEFLNSPEHLTFTRMLTGESRIRRVSAQATCYRSGHFLRRHNDFNAEDQRLYAYVINLSRDWQADWGGQLQFLGEDGGVLETFLPRWNSLSLFKVPADHVVTPVAAWAEQDRLSITGWFQA